MDGTSTILFLHAQTSLHPGSGTAAGAIDLPVQRERHTGWPLIPGSTIKGVLRDYCRTKEAPKFQDDGKDIEENKRKTRFQKADEDAVLECVFGPSQKSNRADEHAGALAVTDARIILFPVRSLCGLFAYVTCPAALDRLRRDAELTDGKINLKPPSIELKSEENAARVVPDAPLASNQAAAGGSNMVLEEFDFIAEEDTGLKTFAETMSGILRLDRIATHITVVNDDMFTHFVKNATEVNARIALEYETKTASGGALFYVETLPPETVFYSLLIADRPKKNGKAETSVLKDEKDVMDYIIKALTPANGCPAVLQIGGEASTGKGICRAILHGGDK